MPQTSNLKEKEQLKKDIGTRFPSTFRKCWVARALCDCIGKFTFRYNKFITSIKLKKKTFPPKINMSPMWLRKKERPERYFMFGFIASFAGIIPSAGLPSLFDFFPAETPLYFVALYYAFFVLWILLGVLNALEENRKPAVSSGAKPKV